MNGVDDRDYLPQDAWRSEGAPVTVYADSEWRRSTAYPPSRGRHGQGSPPVTGPVPGYPRPDGRRASGNSLSSGGPIRAGTGPMPASTGPMPGYPPPNGRPATGYPRPDGRNGRGHPPPKGRPAPGYAPVNGGPVHGSRLSGSGPLPAAAGPAPGYPPLNGWAAPRYPPSGGKRILGWLPFGNRLVLLPKDGSFGAGDEVLREHRDVSGGWLRPAVFGAMDGLVTNSSLIAGIGGGGGAHGTIVLTGIAGLIAGAFSMATGEYISVTSQNELTAAEVELERKQHLRDPVGKHRRLTEVFVGKGVSPNLAEAVVRQISADPERAVATHVREELGIDPDDLPSPRIAAGASFAAFTVGALIPLSLFLMGYPSLKAALVISGVAAVVGGAAVARLTGRSLLMGGLRQFTAAFLATGMAFLIGHLVGGHIS